MKKSDRPIGVFDSGLGGLTVFEALSRRMPNESLVYFGDTAHVPYGSKSAEAITRYSTEIARFLARKGVKAIVIACNTSSALALPAIKRAVTVPVIGVIEPGARAASSGRPGRVGIIGTEATVASGAYETALRRSLPGVKTVAAACPLFVPLVEEGWWDDAVTREVAKRYLYPLKKKKINALILGCTHYPVLKKIIAKTMGRNIRLIDSAEETALETERRLIEAGLRRVGGTSRRSYFVSDAPRRFLNLSRRFLGIPVREVSLKRFS